MDKLLSIVIPTKDRYDYLFDLLKLINDFQSDEIEIVLQDNTYINEPILKYLDMHKNYHFVKYYHTQNQIPISLNSDLAIKNSSGKYVCFIGDDDGVTNYIMECVRWMNRNDVDVVVPSNISYYWPSYISSATGKIGGSMSYANFNFSIKKMNIEDVLLNNISNGFVDRGELPLLYHGIARRSVLDKIYEKTGTFFPGQSPDIANGVALCFTAKTYYKIDAPIIISGASKSHGGGSRLVKNGYAEIESVPFLSEDAKSNWEKHIPTIWCGPTIWCESAIKSLRKMGHENLVQKVNFEKLYLTMSVNNLALKKFSLKYTSNPFKFRIKLMIYFMLRCFNASLRLGFRLMHLEYPLTLKRIYNVENIYEANSCLMKDYPSVIFKDINGKEYDKR